MDVSVSQFFLGAIDRTTPETQLLGTPVSTKYVRILPVEFNNQAGLRLEVLGCTPDCKTLVSPPKSVAIAVFFLHKNL